MLYGSTLLRFTPRHRYLLHGTQGMCKVILLLSQATLDDMGDFLWHHGNAIDDGTNGHAQRTARAVIGDVGDMGLGIEFNGLVAGIGTGHVAFAAVDTEVLEKGRDKEFSKYAWGSSQGSTHIINQGHLLLLIIQTLVGTNMRQGPANNILDFGYPIGVTICGLAILSITAGNIICFDFPNGSLFFTQFGHFLLTFLEIGTKETQGLKKKIQKFKFLSKIKS